MEQDNVRVTVRVDKNLKKAADELFDYLGMNMTTALNVFLRKAVDERCIPFPISEKSDSNGEFSVAEVTKSFQRAVKDATSYNTQKGYPVARYDSATKSAYLEYPDGTREYVE